MVPEPEPPALGFEVSEVLGTEPVRRGARADPEPEPEWLVVREPREPWHPPRWLAGVLVVAVLVGGIAWYVDHRVRVREGAQVARCERLLADASSMADLRMGAMASYIRPALSSVRGGQQLHLADLMARPARRVLPDVQRADRVCRAVSVEPWHFSLASRRNASAAYSGALVTLLQAVAAQGRAYFHDDATLLGLRHAAGIEGPGSG
jgi:hypothetical protein